MCWEIQGIIDDQVSSQCLDHITFFRNSGMRERERQREKRSENKQRSQVLLSFVFCLELILLEVGQEADLSCAGHVTTPIAGGFVVVLFLNRFTSQPIIVQPAI